MKKYPYTLALGIALVFASCGTETNENTQETEAHAEHEHQSEDESLQLDNGEKWVVHEEMMVHIKNMEKDLEQFESQEENDFSVLAVKLQDNIDLLTSSCTMTGESHDELHKWLLPFINSVSELSSAENDVDANATCKEIQASFDTFNTYFK